jgi:hypothetical protein
LKSRAKLPAYGNALLRFPATQRAKHQLGYRNGLAGVYCQFHRP